MASDTRATLGDMSFPTKKIHKAGDSLVGCAGGGNDCDFFIRWVAAGMIDDQRPVMESPDEFQALVLNYDGLFYYDHSCVAYKIERDFHAIGTGGMAALAALMCGKTPKRAVEIACKINPNSGLPVEVLSL